MALSFIASGRRAAADAGATRVRAEVLARYSDRLEEKSWITKIYLRWRIRREIQKDLKKLLPRSTLF
jgi:hypothetical protein